MLEYETVGSRATLTINDPERRNPLTSSVIDGLIDAFRDLSTRPEIRVVVITGAGDKAFCAGGDLTGGFFDEPVALHRQRGRLADLFREMRRCGKPIVARVNGHCLAGGLGLALACDIVIASDRATFGVPEINVGLFPMMISAVIQRALPHKAALELMLTGRRIGPEEALSLGVVSRIVGADVLDASVDELCVELASKSPAMVTLGKDAFYAVQDLGFDAALDYLQAGLTAVTLTEDATEGLSAFMEKRPPEFKGR